MIGLTVFGGLCGKIIAGATAASHMMKNNIFNKNYDNSIKSGKLLANLLAKENIFSYHESILLDSRLEPESFFRA